jgi:hypothetical protein
MANLHKIRHLWHLEPETAKKMVLDAIKKAKGRKAEAAQILECKHGTMLAWIHEFGIEAEVEAIVEQLRAKGVAPQGPREWEVVDRNGERLGTYATLDNAQERANQTRGAEVRRRVLTPKERAKAEDMARRTREWKAANKAPKKRARRAA